MKYKLPLTIILLFLLTTFLSMISTVFAQQNSPKIHPTLQVALISASANEMVDVYAKLTEQYLFDDLKQQTQHLSKKEKQKEVVRILKEYAADKQRAVLAYLENAKQQNLVSKLNILWAANTVIFSAVPQVIYGLAEDFDEIAEIRYDAPIDESLLIDPTEESQILPPNKNGDNPPTPQQGLILINAPAVWAEGDSGQGVLAANHDSGCDWDHPDLINNIWNNLGEDFDNDGHTVEWTGSTWVFDPGDINGIDDDSNGYIDDFIGWDFSGNDNDPNTSETHGTKTAGIVCGDGTNGTQTGVAPKTKLINCRLSGEATSWLAIQYSVDMGVDVITSSHSYKWYFNPQPGYPMHRLMNDFELAAGVVHTNSTSNDGNSVGVPFNISAPGNTPPSWIHPDQTLVGGVSSVIGVGNVHASTDIILTSSPWGPWAWEDFQINHPGYPYSMPIEYQDYPYETIPDSIGLIKPDVSAPGNGTVSTNNGGGYSSFSGTSGATPHVCGLVALVLSVNPELTPEQVSMIIQTTAVEKGAAGKDNRYGAGRIDAYEAYQLALAMVPVELTSFSGRAEENNVLLSWRTATETNNQGFEIQRSNVGKFEKIGFVPGHGTISEIQSYNFIDENVLVGEYSYRLKQMDYDGTTEYSSVIEVEITQPIEYSLGQNYPNPFNPSTTISYSILKDGLVTLKVYDVLGKEVVTLINEVQSAGTRDITFDASQLSSGVYYYQLVSGEFTSTKKLILMK
jgi:subtilisin family serine protease